MQLSSAALLFCCFSAFLQTASTAASAPATRYLCPSAALYFDLNASEALNQISWSNATSQTTLTNFGVYNAVTNAYDYNIGDYSGFSWFDLGGSATTITSWFRIDTVNDYAPIFFFGGAPTEQYVYAGLQLNNGIRAGYGTYVSNTRTEFSVATPANAFTVGAWAHLAVVIDVSGSVSIFINGTSLATRTNTNAALNFDYVNRTAAYLAKSAISTDGAFVGSIADIGVYYETLQANSLQGIVNGALALCPAYSSSYIISQIALGTDLASNVTGNFVGKMFDFQIYGSTLVKGTDSCAPAPPPQPPLPPIPPAPPPPPPNPPLPPSFRLNDTTVSGSLRLHFNSSSFDINSVSWTVRGDIISAFYTMLGYTSPNAPSTNDLLITELIDGGFNDDNFPTVVVGFVIRASAQFNTDEIIGRLSTMIPAILPTAPALATFKARPSLSNSGLYMMNLNGPLGETELPFATYPSAATSIVLNGTTIDNFDNSDAKSLAAAINQAMGLPDYAVIVTGVNSLFDGTGAIVPGFVVVGIAIYDQINSTGLIAKLETMIPSPDPELPSRNTVLIGHVQGMGLPHLNGIYSTGAMNFALKQQNLTNAIEFGSITVLIRGVAAVEFQDYLQAELAAALAFVLGANSASVGVIGVAQSPTYADGTLVGISLDSDGIIDATTELARLVSMNTGVILRTLQGGGLPQITSFSTIGSGFVRELANFPPVTSYVAACSMIVTGAGGAGPDAAWPNDAVLAALVSDVASDVSVSELNIYMNGYTNIDTNTFLVGFTVNQPTLASINAFVTALQSRSPTRTVLGLPQVTNSTLLGVAVSAPSDLSNFAPPAAITQMYLGFPIAPVAFDEPQRRALLAAAALALSTNSTPISGDLIEINDVVMTPSGATVTFAVSGAASVLVTTAMTPGTALNNKFVNLIQRYGIPQVTSISTAFNSPTTDVMYILPPALSYSSPFFNSFAIQLNTGTLSGVELTAIAAMVVKSMGVPTNSLTLTSYIPSDTNATVGFVVNVGSASDALSIFELMSPGNSQLLDNINTVLDESGFMSDADATFASVLPPPMPQVVNTTNAAIVTIKMMGIATNVLTAPIQSSILATLINTLGLPTACCSILGASAVDSVVTFNIASGMDVQTVTQLNTDTVRAKLQASIKLSALPSTTGIAVPLAAVAAPQYVKMGESFGTITTLSLTVLAGTPAFTTVQDQALMAIICNTLALPAGCVSVIGSSMLDATQTYGLLFASTDVTDIMTTLNALEHACGPSNALLYAFKANGIPAIISLSSVGNPVIAHPPAIVQGVAEPLVHANLQLDGAVYAQTTDEDLLALSAALANYFGVAGDKLDIIDVSRSNAGITVGIAMQAVDSTNAQVIQALTTSFDGTLFEVLKQSGFPHITSAVLTGPAQIAVPTKYNATTVGNSGSFMIGTTDIKPTYLSSIAAQTALKSGLSTATGVPTSCIFISTTSNAWTNNGNELEIPIAINCDSTGKSFTSKHAAETFMLTATEAILPSPGRSAVLLNAFINAGLSEMVNVIYTVSPPESAPSKATTASTTMSMGVIIGIAAGGVVLILVVIAGALLYKYRSRIKFLKPKTIGALKDRWVSKNSFMKNALRAVTNRLPEKLARRRASDADGYKDVSL